MYGTTEELCAKLRRDHDPDEKLTLIVWTTETIMATLDDDAVTEDIASEILPQIGDLDGVHECGVGLETLQVMHENIRRDQEEKRLVEVPAMALSQVLALAGQFLKMHDIQAGETSTQRLFREERDALQKVIAATQGE